MPLKSPEARARRREREREYAARKKEEIRALTAQMPPVQCECGCGTLIPALTTSGKPRRFADMHGGRTPKFRAGTWQAFAGPRFDATPACSGEDPEVFFDETLSGLAKPICGRCPVREQCLSWALESGEHEGVWGGLTSRERARLGRRPSDVSVRDAIEAASVRGLTYREKAAAVEWLTAHGKTADEIAQRLHMSSRTVVRWRGRLKETS